MRRRGLFLAFGVGICGGLLPACSTTAPVCSPEAPLAAQERSPEAAPLQTVAARPAPPTGIKTQLIPPENGPPVDLIPSSQPSPTVEQDREVLPASLSKENAADAVTGSSNYAVPPSLPPPVATEIRVPEEPLLGSLRCFLEKHPAEAVALLERYEKPNQELLLSLLPLAARLTEGNIEQASPQDVAVVVDQLNTLAEPLRARAKLAIEKMCFCKKDGIKAFGVYEPLPDDHAFRPGQWIHVYVELRNFSSERRQTPNGQTLYVTRLASFVTLSKEGRPDWQQALERNRPDESRTLRHDYFDHCHFCLPENIPPGQYTLEIKVTDEPTGRTARNALPFRVANAPGKGT